MLLLHVACRCFLKCSFISSCFLLFFNARVCYVILKPILFINSLHFLLQSTIFRTTMCFVEFLPVVVISESNCIGFMSSFLKKKKKIVSKWQNQIYIFAIADSRLIEMLFVQNKGTILHFSCVFSLHWKRKYDYPSWLYAVFTLCSWHEINFLKYWSFFSCFYWFCCYFNRLLLFFIPTIRDNIYYLEIIQERLKINPAQCQYL